MPSIPACPQCTLENTYADGERFVCADCGFEWVPETDEGAASTMVVRDSNGNMLVDGRHRRRDQGPQGQGLVDSAEAGHGDPQDPPGGRRSEHIEGNSDKIKGLVLKTCFLRKA